MQRRCGRSRSEKARAVYPVAVVQLRAGGAVPGAGGEIRAESAAMSRIVPRTHGSPRARPAELPLTGLTAPAGCAAWGGATRGTRRTVTVRCPVPRARPHLDLLAYSLRIVVVWYVTLVLADRRRPVPVDVHTCHIATSKLSIALIAFKTS